MNASSPRRHPSLTRSGSGGSITERRPSFATAVAVTLPLGSAPLPQFPPLLAFGGDNGEDMSSSMTFPTTSSTGSTGSSNSSSSSSSSVISLSGNFSGGVYTSPSRPTALDVVHATSSAREAAALSSFQDNLLSGVSHDVASFSLSSSSPSSSSSLSSLSSSLPSSSPSTSSPSCSSSSLLSTPVRSSSPSPFVVSILSSPSLFVTRDIDDKDKEKKFCGIPTNQCRLASLCLCVLFVVGSAWLIWFVEGADVALYQRLIGTKIDQVLPSAAASVIIRAPVSASSSSSSPARNDYHAAPETLVTLGPFASFAGLQYDPFSTLTVAIIGDWGFPSQEQAATATAMNWFLQSKKSPFVISAGDQFYPRGLRTKKDIQVQTTFELRFTGPNLQVPWYVINGNHDCEGSVSALMSYARGLPKTRLSFPKRLYFIDQPISEDGAIRKAPQPRFEPTVESEVAASFSSSSFSLSSSSSSSFPSPVLPPVVRFIFVDTCVLACKHPEKVSSTYEAQACQRMAHSVADQDVNEHQRWLASVLRDSNRRRRRLGGGGGVILNVLVGHHPSFSSGVHSHNMLVYDVLTNAMEEAEQETRREEDGVSKGEGNKDGEGPFSPPLVYVSGHDHSLQHLSVHTQRFRQHRERTGQLKKKDEKKGKKEKVMGTEKGAGKHKGAKKLNTMSEPMLTTPSSTAFETLPKFSSHTFTPGPPSKAAPSLSAFSVSSAPSSFPFPPPPAAARSFPVVREGAGTEPPVGSAAAVAVDGVPDEKSGGGFAIQVAHDADDADRGLGGKLWEGAAIPAGAHRDGDTDAENPDSDGDRDESGESALMETAFIETAATTIPANVSPPSLSSPSSASFIFHQFITGGGGKRPHRVARGVLLPDGISAEFLAPANGFLALAVNSTVATFSFISSNADVLHHHAILL